MKVTLIFFFSFFLSLSAFSFQGITAKKLRSNVELEVQTFLMSADGSRILSITAEKGRYRNQTKTGEIKSVWTTNFDETLPPVNLDFTMKINEDNSISLSVTEYAKISYPAKDGAPKKEGRGRSDTFQVSNFQSISWVTKVDDEKSLVTRFAPTPSDESEAMKLTYIPMILSNVIISDNQGKVWQEGSGGSGEVVGFASAQGTLYVSFSEFKGSEELGTASESAIELKLSDKLTVRIRSSQTIIASGINAKVYGKYLPEKRTKAGVSGGVTAGPAAFAEKQILERK